MTAPRSNWQTEEFERHRSHLRAVAYRMLGSLADADDVLQEAWLRLDRADAESVENMRGWLTTVVARLSLDELRARKARSETAGGSWLPEPVVAPETGDDPEQEALLADSVGLALLVVLETLTPPERLAFVLHDMFALPFDEIAPIVGRTPGRHPPAREPRTPARPGSPPRAGRRSRGPADGRRRVPGRRPGGRLRGARRRARPRRRLPRRSRPAAGRRPPAGSRARLRGGREGHPRARRPVRRLRAARARQRDGRARGRAGRERPSPWSGSRSRTGGSSRSTWSRIARSCARSRSSSDQPAGASPSQ